MKIYGAYLKTVDGGIHFDNVTLKDEVFGDTHIVSVCGEADNYLDEDFAATFVFDPQNVSEYMCDYRHSEYWCRPFFGKELWQVHNRTQGKPLCQGLLRRSRFRTVHKQAQGRRLPLAGSAQFNTGKSLYPCSAGRICGQTCGIPRHCRNC